MPVTPALLWSWYPSVLVGLGLWNLAYFLAAGPLRRRYGWGPPVAGWRQAVFALGSLALFVALCSPLDYLGDEYLFSAHMAQHMLLTFTAPPLWLLGLPDWAWERLLPPGRLRRAAALVASPLAAFVVFTGVMWAWHLPAAYNLALEHEGIHIVEHLTFIGSALVGWAAVLLPPAVLPVSRPVRAFYLFALVFPCTALAALFTLSGQVFYPFYAAAPRAWGMAALADQQLGGLLMWLPGDMVLMAAGLLVFGRWLNQQERAGHPAA